MTKPREFELLVDDMGYLRITAVSDVTRGETIKLVEKSYSDSLLQQLAEKDARIKELEAIIRAFYVIYQRN